MKFKKLLGLTSFEGPGLPGLASETSGQASGATISAFISTDFGTDFALALGSTSDTDSFQEERLYDRKSDPEAKVIPEITSTGPLIACHTRLTVLLYHAQY